VGFFLCPEYDIIRFQITRNLKKKKKIKKKKKKLPPDITTIKYNSRMNQNIIKQKEMKIFMLFKKF